MKPVFGLLLCLAITSSCVAAASEHQALMTFIEDTVRLPEGARPIEQYSRNYALRPDGKIVAIYVVPYEPTVDGPEDEGCEVVLEDLDSRPCTEAEIVEIAQQDAATASAFGDADRSRWFDNYHDLPAMLDGGCMQIEIIFDPRSKKIEHVECNGFT